MEYNIEEVSTRGIDKLGSRDLQPNFPLTEFVKECIYFSEIVRRKLEEEFISDKNKGEELSEEEQYYIDEIEAWIDKLKKEIYGFESELQKMNIRNKNIRNKNIRNKLTIREERELLIKLEYRTLKDKGVINLAPITLIQKSIMNMREEGIRKKTPNINDLERILSQIHTYYLQEFLPFLREAMEIVEGVRTPSEKEHFKKREII